MDLVGVFPDVVEVQPFEREESAVGAVEILDLVCKFQIVFFLIAGVEVGLENRLFRVDAQCLDKACVVQLVEDFLADGLQRRHVGIEQDEPDAAALAQVAENVDELEVREHGEHADAPCLFDRAGGATPTKEVVLVRINLDIQERPTRPVGPQELFVEASPE